MIDMLIAQKLKISQPTLREHMKSLTKAGLVSTKRIKQWTFPRRNEKRIAEVKRSLVRSI